MERQSDKQCTIRKYTIMFFLYLVSVYLLRIYAENCWKCRTNYRPWPSIKCIFDLHCSRKKNIELNVPNQYIRFLLHSLRANITIYHWQKNHVFSKDKSPSVPDLLTFFKVLFITWHRTFITKNTLIGNPKIR